MPRKLALAVVVTALLVLGGCAGQDFVRSEAADLKVGKSTYAEVVAKMGQPRNTGEVLKNGQTIKTISYAYAATGGEPLQAGVIPARAMAYYFHGDRLVGQEFLSSFKSDNSNFDEAKVPGIVKGKTTRAEVISALGPPTSIFIKPIVKETSGEAIGYSYQTTSGGVFSGFKFYRKTLVIAFDGADRVLEVDYSTSGSQ